MQTWLATIWLGVLVLSGCTAQRGGSLSFNELSITNNPSVSLAKPNVIITSDNLLVGKVAKANVDGRFVVLTFPIGHLPTLDQRLSLYRRGLKVGEVKITGPQLDDNVVGDIVTGDAQAGDEVRAQ
jgi:hypothetical protein